MTCSIITVCYNSVSYLADCIESVLAQDYPHIEHILVDGASTDGSREVIESYSDRIGAWISEPDNGLYDAMNKGLKMASGDIIGILNSDDLYMDAQVISKVIHQLDQSKADSLFADLVYVREHDLDRVVRFFPGKDFHPSKLAKGLMPPHPTFFVRKELYQQYGDFDTSYEICADFDLMVRFFHQFKVSYTYLPETLVKMRTGGSSTQGIQSTLTINREMLKACRKYGIDTSLAKIYSKYFKKVFQLVNR